MPRAVMVVNHPIGLHARPAAEFVETASRFDSLISIRNMSTGSQPVDAKNIVDILTLAVVQGHVVEVEATGVDEDEALEHLVNLVEANFNE